MMLASALFRKSGSCFAAFGHYLRDTTYTHCLNIYNSFTLAAQRQKSLPNAPFSTCF